jgi:hypothetical protein
MLASSSDLMQHTKKTGEMPAVFAMPSRTLNRPVHSILGSERAAVSDHTDSIYGAPAAVRSATLAPFFVGCVLTNYHCSTTVNNHCSTTVAGLLGGGPKAFDHSSVLLPAYHVLLSCADT